MKRCEVLDIFKGVRDNTEWADFISPVSVSTKEPHFTYCTAGFTMQLRRCASNNERGRLQLSYKNCHYTLPQNDPFTLFLFEWERYLRCLMGELKAEIPVLPESGGRGYYVYGAVVDGELMYIGKGVADRYKHCTSGVSRCYKLNEAHFKGKTVEVVKMVEGLSEEKAYSLERYYINLFAPEELYNIQRHKNKGVIK